MGHPLYHLELEVRRCRAELRLNDIPLISVTSQDEMPVSFAPPCNPYLVGDLNMVDVHIHPLIAEDGSPSSFWDARVDGNVRRYEKGDIVAPGAGDMVTEFSIPDELKERVREDGLELPQSFTHVFSNDMIDFSDELSFAAPFDDRELLIDYAMRLRDLVAARDADGLLGEMDPKIHVWVAAYDEPYEAFAESLREGIVEFLAESPIVDFDRDQIELRQCCSGRLWEIIRAPDLPLLQTEPDSDGAIAQIPVVVGLREGVPRVVR